MGFREDHIYLFGTKTLAFQRETERLEDSGVLLGYQFLSLKEFLRETFRQYYPRAKVLSEEGQMILLAKLLDRFSSYDFRVGDSLSQFIAEIKLSLSPPEKFLAKANAQFMILFDYYADELKRYGLKDKSDLFLSALGIIEERDRKIKPLEGKKGIVIEGLSEDHRLWYAVIKGLSFRMPVTVKLPFAASDSAGFPHIAAIMENLEQLAGTELTIEYSVFRLVPKPKAMRASISF
ncbi:MAG: hypothetical protein ACE5GM_01360 [bacterium]